MEAAAFCGRFLSFIKLIEREVDHSCGKHRNGYKWLPMVMSQLNDTKLTALRFITMMHYSQ